MERLKTAQATHGAMNWICGFRNQAGEELPTVTPCSRLGICQLCFSGGTCHVLPSTLLRCRTPGLAGQHISQTDRCEMNRFPLVPSDRKANTFRDMWGNGLVTLLLSGHKRPSWFHLSLRRSRDSTWPSGLFLFLELGRSEFQVLSHLNLAEVQNHPLPSFPCCNLP